MNIRDDIANKYWLLAAQEQTEADLAADGFVVTRDERLGGLQADLVARRGQETVVFEFKSGSTTAAKTKAIQQLHDYAVHTLGAQFRLVWIAAPRDKIVEVEGLEQKLCDHMIDNLPAELDSLSTHTLVENVSDVLITSVTVRRNSVTISGEGTVEVELSYGSAGDAARGDGGSFSDSYPFEFNVVLNPVLEIVEILRLDVDTSSFYE